jgi:hypothetical protein
VPRLSWKDVSVVRSGCIDRRERSFTSKAGRLSPSQSEPANTAEDHVHCVMGGSSVISGIQERMLQAPWHVGRASSSYPLLRCVSAGKLSLRCPPACLPTACRHTVDVTCKGGCRRGWEQTLSEMGALSRSFFPLHIFSFLITRTDHGGQTIDENQSPGNHKTL